MTTPQPTAPQPCGEETKGVIEQGPWTARQDGRAVQSDDFTHDVVMEISGDFADEYQRHEYAHEISRRLNAYTDAPLRALVAELENYIVGEILTGRFPDKMMGVVPVAGLRAIIGRVSMPGQGGPP